jgi:protein with PEP-CTERM/exosortase system signal
MAKRSYGMSFAIRIPVQHTLTAEGRQLKRKSQLTITTMKTTSYLLIAIAALAVLSPIAKADQEYSFSYTDNSEIFASGDLFTSGPLVSNVDGSGLSGYDVTGITGERNGVAITGIILNPSFPGSFDAGPVIYDNILLVGPLSFDNSGLLFSTSDGGEYNLFSNDVPIGGGYTDFNVLTGAEVSPIFLTISQVPDSSSTALLLGCALAACLLVAVASRKKTPTRRILI